MAHNAIPRQVDYPMLLDFGEEHVGSDSDDEMNRIEYPEKFKS